MRFAIILAFLLISPSISIDCLNQSDEAVDWWVILKMPKISGIFPNGIIYTYFFLTENLYKAMTTIIVIN